MPIRGTELPHGFSWLLTDLRGSSCFIDRTLQLIPPGRYSPPESTRGAPGGILRGNWLLLPGAFSLEGEITAHTSMLLQHKLCHSLKQMIRQASDERDGTGFLQQDPGSG